MSVLWNWSRGFGFAAGSLALLAAPLFSHGQEETDAPEPLAVIAVAPAERLLGADDDSAGAIGYLTKQLGHPDWGMMAKFLSAGYLKELDPQKPWGIYVLPDLEQPAGVAFLPVADVTKVFEMLEEYVEPVEGENGVYSVEANGQTLYAKSVDGWTYVSNEVGAFESLIPNPESLIADLSQDYLVAAELRIQAIPEDYSQMMIGEMRSGLEQGLEDQEDENAREFAEQYGEAMVQNVEDLFEQGDRLSIGWGVDEEAGTTFLDVTMTVLPDSDLDSQIEQASDAAVPTRFAGFKDAEAAISLVAVALMMESDKEQFKSMLAALERQSAKEIDEDEELETDADKEKAKSIMHDIVVALEKTIDAGVMSFAGSMTLGEEELDVVAAAEIVDGHAMSASFEELIALKQDKLEEKDVTIEKTEQEGVIYHVVTAPVPEDEEDARKMFGDEVTVIVGFAEDAVYVAFGSGAQEKLDAAIAASEEAGEQEVLPMEFAVSLAKIVTFAAGQPDADERLSAIAETLKGSQGRDHVYLTTDVVEHGARFRLLLQDGVLKAIGQAIDLYGAGGGEDDF